MKYEAKRSGLFFHNCDLEMLAVSLRIRVLSSILD